MREILFKAKRNDNGEWVVGDLSHHKTGKVFVKPLNGSAISSCEVDKDTVCQCTGLKDKNGNLIWENDITLRTSVTGTHKGKIIYSSDGSFCQKDFDTTFENLLIHSESYFEVIGNIFDEGSENIGNR